MGKFALGLMVGIIGVALAFISSEPGYHDDMTVKGYVSYPQQRQDKELCERDIKRSERCVPVMMWLPEVAQ